MNKIARVALIVFIAIIVVSILFALFMFIAFGGLTFLVYVPKPEITYGEFPIKLTYELDGEIIVIEDTVVCEFDGFEVLGEAGKYRKWKSHLKSGNTGLTMLRVEDEALTYEIFDSYGSPEYYMGDFTKSKEEYEKSMFDNDYFSYVQRENGNVTGGRIISKEEAWEKYKIRVINVEYSQPIENTFK